MIYDEAFCMQLAYDSGLTTHPVWIENFDGAEPDNKAYENLKTDITLFVNRLLSSNEIGSLE
jgi:hypothetical protein